MKPPVEAPASRAPSALDEQSLRDEGLEGPGELVAAARDVVGVVVVLDHDDGRGGLDLGGGLGGDGLADGHPARGDQLAGVLARARELAPYQLGVETAACHSCHVRFSSCCRADGGGVRVERGQLGAQSTVYILVHLQVSVRREVVHLAETRQVGVDSRRGR